MNFYKGPSLLNLIEKDYEDKNSNNFGTIAIVQNVLRGENNDRLLTIKNLNSRFSMEVLCITPELIKIICKKNI